VAQAAIPVVEDARGRFRRERRDPTGVAGGDQDRRSECPGDLGTATGDPRAREPDRDEPSKTQVPAREDPAPARIRASASIEGSVGRSVRCGMEEERRDERQKRD
jgi:hypothetical protein